MSHFFRISSLHTFVFNAWKAHYKEVKRCKDLLQRLYETFQFNTLENIFHKWCKFHEIVVNARRMLPRWIKVASDQRRLRKAARWWSKGLIIRTFQTWQLYCITVRNTCKALAMLNMGSLKKCFMAWHHHIVTSKRMKVELGDKSMQFWATRSKKKALSIWHEFARDYGAIRKHLRRAMNWMQGNVLTKMWFNWVSFVQGQKDFKRAVNMWRMSSAKRCYWAWAYYARFRREKKECKVVGNEGYSTILKRRGLRRLMELISEENRQKKKVRRGGGEGRRRGQANFTIVKINSNPNRHA